jgi:hypothetical protein
LTIWADDFVNRRPSTVENSKERTGMNVRRSDRCLAI